MPDPQFRAIVSGRVQGVGFRAHTLSVATRLGLRGRARNLPDGTVLVLAQGARPALEQLLAWLDHGPPSARVERVSWAWVDGHDLPPGFSLG